MNTNVCIFIFGALCASGLLETVQAAGPTTSPQATLVAPKGASELRSARFFGILDSKIRFVSRVDDKVLNRHYTPFSGPPGPTLPYGATLSPTRSGKSDFSVLRYSAESKPFIYDFPPGAKLRQVAANK